MTFEHRLGLNMVALNEHHTGARSTARKRRPQEEADNIRVFSSSLE